MFAYRFPNEKDYKEEDLYPITDAMVAFDDPNGYYLDLETAQVQRCPGKRKNDKRLIEIPRFKETHLMEVLRDYIENHLDMPADNEVKEELTLALDCGKDYKGMMEVMKRLGRETFRIVGVELLEGTI